MDEHLEAGRLEEAPGAFGEERALEASAGERDDTDVVQAASDGGTTRR